jgi:SAM-dependent methyltransferase
VESYFNDSDAYLEFVQWHADNGVKLYWVSDAVVEQIRTECGMPSDADVSLWVDKYAVLFIPGPRDQKSDSPKEGGVVLRMLIPNEQGHSGISFDGAMEFVVRVGEAREELGYGPPPVSVTDKVVAAQWEKYVSPRERLRPGGPLALLLEGELEGHRDVLDAAAGIGSESVFLIKELGKNVTSNEVDVSYRTILSQYALEHDVRLEVKSGSWERLPDCFNGGAVFDAILCLGNSICLVESEPRRHLSLLNFTRLLSEDGVLIIDERNFARIISERSEIITDPMSFVSLREDTMYMGKELRGIPVSISETLIEWSVFRLPEGRTVTMNDIRTKLHIGDPFKLVPFRHGQLVQELRRAGLTITRTYIDLCDPIEGGAPPEAALQSAQFFTYICKKERESKLKSGTR